MERAIDKGNHRSPHRIHHSIYRGKLHGGNMKPQRRNMKTLTIDRKKTTGKEVRELLDQWLENSEEYDIVIKTNKKQQHPI